MKTSKQEKERRAALLTEQQNRCALCYEPMSTAFRMILAKKQNAIICRACGQYVYVYTAALARGVTANVLIAFLAQEPAPEPGPASEAAQRATHERAWNALEAVHTGEQTTPDERMLIDGVWCDADGEPLTE